MQQQLTKQTGLINQNPQSYNVNQSQRMKQNPGKKKALKIKKSKNGSFHKQKHSDLYSDPIYVGLQDQCCIVEDQHKFGPWIDQRRNLQKGILAKNTKAQSIDVTYMKQGFPEQRASLGGDSFYFQVPLRSAILQENERAQISYLPQLRPKRSLKEIRFSSLNFNPDKRYTKTSFITSISPKLSKNKQQLMVRSKSKDQVVDLLKYETLKYLPLTQKIFQLKFSAKPSNVNFNYCCSYNNDNNTALNYFRETNYGQRYNKNSPGNFKSQKDQLMQGKINRKSLIQNKIMQKYELTKNLGKTISKELYKDLIKKKNKTK